MPTNNQIIDLENEIENLKNQLSELAANELNNTRYELMWENQIETIKKLKAELKVKAGNIDIPSLKITIL